MRLWMLRDPSGKEINVFRTKIDAWFNSYDYQSQNHKDMFWKEPKASQKILKIRGWTVVRGTFVEDK